VNYYIDPEFGSKLLVSFFTNESTYRTIGLWVEEEMFTDEPKKVLLRAIHEIYKDTGSPPKNEAIVFQRLQRWVNEGAIRIDVVNNINDVIVDAKKVSTDTKLLIQEIVPQLKDHWRHKYVKELIAAHGQKQNLAKQLEMLRSINMIGEYEDTVGVTMGANAKEVIAAMANFEVLPMGIDGLDSQLGGGSRRQEVTVWIGSTGEGKSFALSHVAAAAVAQGKSVLYVSLEIPIGLVLTRAYSALSGYSVTEFEECSPDAMGYIDELMPKMGSFRVVSLPYEGTTCADLEQQLRRAEEIDGRPVDLLCVDYLDLLSSTSTESKQASGHTQVKKVMLELQNLAKEKNLYCHTAAQATRQNSGSSKMKGTEDASEGMGKVRIADRVFTLNVQVNDQNERVMSVFVAKNRTGSSQFVCGPSRVLFAYGLVAPSTLLGKFHGRGCYLDEYASSVRDYDHSESDPEIDEFR
jgi:replicative DNA helicase